MYDQQFGLKGGQTRIVRSRTSSLASISVSMRPCALWLFSAWQASCGKFATHQSFQGSTSKLTVVTRTFVIKIITNTALHLHLELLEAVLK